ncbi:pentapeptide repeat-containing protein [Burkholderia cenocepacia]|uniref:pentapeptide repeat-containing protein n=1 Tax=Burkholderia cenocepacia TaxID=95486 RepID=UPI001B9C82BA|nr:pentapeptide repeat-containing protein [Burkholderia cenocepacia]MBR8025200.1 pentapeptide repeat-containing protein [Burkholderia cenocepacia]
MKIEILNRWTLKVIFECEADSIKAAVELACKQGVSLSGANLSDANLRGSDLSDANLSGANLRGSDLSGANLSDANLSGANLRGSDLSGANLSGANLSGANLRGSDLSGANLRGANLRGSDLSGANLSDANLSGANLRGSDLSGANLRGVPKIPNIHQAVFAAASQPCALDMGQWHACETTHCRAGWVVTLAGDGGEALEWAMGTSTAATLIYLASDPERWKNERLPDFYCGNDDALADMKRMAEEEAAQA